MTPEQRFKDNARSYAGVYKRRGHLTPEPCSECGDEQSQMHHPDYSKPLEVQWLCRKCHLELHAVKVSFPLGRAWFIAMASPIAMRWNGEFFPAERAIEELGFETYVPRQVRSVRERGRWVERVKPLVGGYIFVKLDRERDDWAQIRPLDEMGVPPAKIMATGADGSVRRGDVVLVSETGPRGGIKGVHGIMRDKFGLLRRVPDVGIERLRRVEMALSDKPAFNPGDDVQITEGPFAGFLAKVRSASPQKRVRLIMAALGDLEIEPEFLERVNSARVGT